MSPGDLAGFGSATAVVGRLTTAGLGLREVNAMPKPLEDLNRCDSRLWKERIDKTGNKQ